MPDRDFLTPLHIACLNNHVETVEMLIGLGANTKAKDRYGRTPLQFLSAAEKPPKRKMKTTRALPSSLC